MRKVRRRRLLAGAGAVVALGLVCAYVFRGELRAALPRPLPHGECTWYVSERAEASGWDIRFDTNVERHARS